MTTLRSLLVLAAVFLALPAQAATCFWVGGTGTWNTSNTASWASATGGTAGSCAATNGIPENNSDSATFDGSSGGGTVTVNANIDIHVVNGTSAGGVLTTGAFTGTLDWSANNNNFTASSWSNSGTGTRTINLGSGTFTLDQSTANGGGVFSNATVTGLTWNTNTATLNVTSSSAATSLLTFSGGGLTYHDVNFNSSSGAIVSITGANTFTTLTVTAGSSIGIASSTTQTVTNAFTITGTASAPVYFAAVTVGTFGTISTASGTATCAWCAFRDIHFTGGATFTASNSLNLGDNSGITITPPSAGGGGFTGIIGGGI